jgi:methyl-accepting chemotaxis protein
MPYKLLSKIKSFTNAKLGTKILVCFLISAVIFTGSIVYGVIVLWGLYREATASGLLIPMIVMGALAVLGIASVIYFARALGAYLKHPLEGMTVGVKELAAGNLSYFDNDMVIPDDTHDEMMLHGHYFLKLVFATREKVADAEQIARGDLTTQVHIKCDKDQMGNALASLVKNTHQTVSSISATAEQVASGADMLSGSSLALSQGATEQASSVQQLTASLAEVSEQTNKSARNAEKADEFAQNAKVKASLGNEQMKEMLTAMDDINASSNNISKIIKVIDDIAFQTNILALNAAVEAARAGQHGKGFAVVAEEVRNLAAKSAAAAKETTDMIENSKKKVDAGTKIADGTAEALHQIVSEIEKAATLVRDIANAANEQATAIDQINNGISLVSQVVQTNAATAQESAAASEELSGQAEQLKDTIAAFKIKEITALPQASGFGRPAIAAKPSISLGGGDFGKY